MKKMVMAKVVDGNMSAEVHAKDYGEAIAMVASIVDAIAQSATEKGLFESKDVAGSVIGYLLSINYVTEESKEAMEMMADKLKKYARVFN